MLQAHQLHRDPLEGNGTANSGNHCQALEGEESQMWPGWA